MFLVQNLSANEIARRSKRTRDAITGKLSSLGVKRSGVLPESVQNAVRLRRDANNGSNQFKGMHRVQALLAQQEKVAAAPPPDIPPDAKPLDALQVWECRWAYGDSNFVFCGKTTKKLGCAWCQEHYDMVYTKREITTNDAD